MEENELRLNSLQLRILRAVMDDFFKKKDDSKLRQMFEIFDRNGNGRLEAIELKSVMEQIVGQRITDSELMSMMEEADSNGNGTIEYSEFAEIMLRFRRVQTEL